MNFQQLRVIAYGVLCFAIGFTLCLMAAQGSYDWLVLCLLGLLCSVALLLVGTALGRRRP